MTDAENNAQILNDAEEWELTFGSQYPDAPKIFLDNAALKNAWSGSERVFLFVPPERAADVNAMLPRAKVFADSSGKRILTNR